METHCRIGRVRLKGSRSVAKRLPLKLIKTSLALKAAVEKSKGRGE